MPYPRNPRSMRALENTVVVASAASPIDMSEERSMRSCEVRGLADELALRTEYTVLALADLAHED